MSDYTPDRWMVIAIHAPREIVYKVFATWSGGYTGGDSWKLNSGIVRARFEDRHWEFDGSSGSVYRCHEHGYGTNGYGQVVLDNLLTQAKEQGTQIDVMPADTDWAGLQYECLAQWMEKGVNDA